MKILFLIFLFPITTNIRNHRKNLSTHSIQTLLVRVVFPSQIKSDNPPDHSHGSRNPKQRSQSQIKPTVPE